MVIPARPLRLIWASGIATAILLLQVSVAQDVQTGFPGLDQPQPSFTECRVHIEAALKKMGHDEEPPVSTVVEGGGTSEEVASVEQLGEGEEPITPQDVASIEGTSAESAEGVNLADTVSAEEPTPVDVAESAESIEAVAESTEPGTESTEADTASTEESKEITEGSAEAAPEDTSASLEVTSAEQEAEAPSAEITKDSAEVEQEAEPTAEGSAEKAESAEEGSGEDTSAEVGGEVSSAEVTGEQPASGETSAEEAAAAASQEVSAEESVEVAGEAATAEEGSAESVEAAGEVEPEASAEAAGDASMESAEAVAEEEKPAVEGEGVTSAEDVISAEDEASAEDVASAEVVTDAGDAVSAEDVTSAEEASSAEKVVSAEEGATSAEEGATSVEEGATSAEEGATSVEEGATSAEEGAPSAEEGATSAEEGATSAEEGATSAEEGAPSAEEGAPSAEEGAPSVEEVTTEEVSPGVEVVESAEEGAATEGAEASKEEVSAEVTEPEVVKEEAESLEAAPAAEEPEEVKEAPRPPEEDLSVDFIVPTERRNKDHIHQVLQLDEGRAETEIILSKIVDSTLKDLKRVYDNAIKPLEILYKYRDLSNRHFGDPEIFSKPLILFMGPWSGGKSTIINYLLDIEYTSLALRTGAEPSPAYFNILMHGEQEEVLDGTQLAADWTFSGLQKFGQGLLDRLRGLRIRNKLLEKVNIVEIPGILEIRKQVERHFPFNDACQWFIDRADIIFLVYDPAKLDVGPETEAILDQLKGREYQVRMILNKADQVKPEELMRVQGTLIWNISPLMSSSEPPVMYSTSLWSLPYEVGAPTRLLYAQELAFLRDIRSAIDKRVENKIASARRFAVRVRNHAKMVDCYLTTYYNHKSIFGNKKKVSDDIIEHPQNYHIYEGLSTLTNISRYDLPDPEVYKDFFQLNALYDFQQLSATCTYFKGCPINKLDISIAYDLPELVGKYKRAVDTVITKASKES